VPRKSICDYRNRRADRAGFPVAADLVNPQPLEYRMFASASNIPTIQCRQQLLNGTEVPFTHGLRIN